MLEFPDNPITGQRYVGINAVTYTWLGNRWNSITAIEQGIAEYYVDSGDANFVFNPDVDNELDGGLA